MNKKQALRVAEKFRKAAEFVDGGTEYTHLAGCAALGMVYDNAAPNDAHASTDYRQMVAGFCEAFKPVALGSYDLWFGTTSVWGRYGVRHHKRVVEANKQHRVMALLLMSEFAKDYS